MKIFIPFSLLLVACGQIDAPGSDLLDAEAEAAAPQPIGKADAAGLSGANFVLSSPTSMRSGDVRSVVFYDDGSYVRSRCYHSYCRSLIPESDHFDLFRTPTRTYVRF